MPLVRKKFRGGITGPVIVCENCAEQITDAGDGNAHWEIDEQGNQRGAFMFSHKRCCVALERKFPGMCMTDDLEVFVVYLLNNLKMTQNKLDAARERATALARI